jgi:undecaprenyl diphosphate synthase
MSTAQTSPIAIDNGNPRHIAIIMDGNGRWAQNRFMPRIMGHHAGVKTVRKIVEYCVKEKIQVLSLFAFSSENWRRPPEEVSLLMKLFNSTLQTQIEKLHKNNIKLLCIGNKSAFSPELQDKIAQGESLTQNNTGLTLVIAANYGGRWDMCQAAQQVMEKINSGQLQSSVITEELIEQHLSTAGLPEPDLFIRTGGEERISNFLLWQLAYTEFYFTPTLWPDFGEQSLTDAINSFRHRQRRFGRTGEQQLTNPIFYNPKT